MKEGVAAHSSTLAWKIPWMEESGRLHYTGLQRVVHDWTTSLSYSILKSRDIILPTKVCLVKAMVFPVVMYECESWTVKKVVLKTWCFWTVMLERTLESPLDCKIKPVNPKENQSWIFIERTDAEAENLIFGHQIGRTDSLERSWRWERLKVGRKGDNRRWDSWMASPIQ